MSRRRLYIPITRSGSSILASILTQLLDRSRENRYPDRRFSYVLMWWGIFFGIILFMLFTALMVAIFER